jgi:hypothetical protein
MTSDNLGDRTVYKLIVAHDIKNAPNSGSLKSYIISIAHSIHLLLVIYPNMYTYNRLLLHEIEWIWHLFSRYIIRRSRVAWSCVGCVHWTPPFLVDIVFIFIYVRIAALEGSLSMPCVPGIVVVCLY